MGSIDHEKVTERFYKARKIKKKQTFFASNTLLT